MLLQDAVVRCQLCNLLGLYLLFCLNDSCCSGVEEIQCLVTHNTWREGPVVAGPGGGHASPQTLPVPLEMAEPRAGGSGRPAWC